VTAVDSRSPAISGTAIPGTAIPAPPPADGPTRPASLTRDPEVRLEALFDPGTVRLLTPHDASGALAATGRIEGVPAVAFASDPRVQGGAMGTAGCAAIVAAYDEAMAQGL
jgi:acetyl-CoA/propionyl-CoA carboxylase carboxyl transferase subunit